MQFLYISIHNQWNCSIKKIETIEVFSVQSQNDLQKTEQRNEIPMGFKGFMNNFPYIYGIDSAFSRYTIVIIEKIVHKTTSGI